MAYALDDSNNSSIFSISDVINNFDDQQLDRLYNEISLTKRNLEFDPTDHDHLHVQTDHPHWVGG